MAWAPDYIDADALGDYMKITHANDDVELAFAASGASRAIDFHCNRQFGVVAAPEARTYEAWYDYDRGVWVIETDDFFGALTSLVIGGTTTTDYTREPLNAASYGKPYERLTIPYTASVLPATPDYLATPTATWGWTAVPTPVKLAARLQGSRFHTRRDSPYGVTGSPDQGGELRLLQRLDPDVAVSLRDYVRPRRPR